MNVQEFISSGILEAYVLGSATPAERTEVETMAARHPEVKEELSAIEDAMNAYALKHAVEPPAHLKDKVLGAIANTPRQADVTKEFRIGPDNAEAEKRSFSPLSIAAAIALLISIPLNIFLYNRLSNDENKITAMNTAVQTLTGSMKDSSVAYVGMRNELYVLKDPMFKMVPLSGLKTAPDAKAMVCWCPGSKELYFEPEKMPAAPKGKQYQLWAIVNGKPVDAGMIDMTPGMQKMKLVANATAFAVTLEKEGGSPMPTGDMYVMGNI
jgi:anti-sigma-K factor RskA